MSFDWTNYIRLADQKWRRRIGLDLDRLRRTRNRADYEARFFETRESTSAALRRAQGIERELKKL